MDRSIELIKTLFDSLNIGLWLVLRENPDDNDSFKVIYCNDAGENSNAVTRDKFVGYRIVDAFPNIKTSGFFDMYVKVLAEGKPSASMDMGYSDHRHEQATYRIKFTPLSDHLLAVTFTNVTLERRAQILLEKKSQAILEMSTPIIELWREIVLLPLVGELDTQRAQQMSEHLLCAIVAHSARVAIFDITGVPVVDTQVAHYLMQSVQAAKMLGTDVLLTGIKPETAITLVKLGVDISDLRTYRSLHRGVTAAFELLGLQIGPRTD